MMKKYQFPLHTILLSLYPIMFLLAQNLQFVRIESSYRSLTFSLSVTILLLVSIQIILRNWEKAGAICSLLIILFYSFGHILNNLNKWAANLNFSINTFHLTWLWLLVFLLVLFIIFKYDFPQTFTKSLNFFSIVLLFFPISTIVLFKLPILEFGQSSETFFTEFRGEAQAERDLPTLSQSEKPDIYYIILDSYERADKLLEFYGFDNSEFITSLEQRGFYVPSSSRSNYLNTTYSLNTSLNLMYIHELPKRPFINSLSNLRNNHVTDFLRNQGYQIVVFQSGTGDSDKQYADIFVISQEIQKLKQPPINSFEQFLLKTTFGRLIIPSGAGDEDTEKTSNAFVSSVNRELSIRRERLNHAFEHLPDYATEPENYFLFAHIYLPHIPFLYGPEGKPLEYQENLSAQWYEPAPSNYNEYYAYQIEYVNKTVLTTIDQILENTTKPVIIVLQADHGDGNYVDRNNLTSLGVDTRSAILNAVYFSDKDYSDFYPTLTPVNTFRVIFNNWFGTKYPLLPDKVYANEHPSEITPNTKPNFIDGCLEFNICIPKAEVVP